MKLLRLRIEADIDIGTAGLDITLPDGLFLLQAENAHGKSQTLLSIVYALGLEGAVSASQSVPFAHVLTEYINISGQRHEVIASRVYLVISNKHNEIKTLRRSIKSGLDHHVIEIANGDAVGQKEGFEAYYVRVQYAAKNPRGFHTFLASFLGLSLPKVSTYGGDEIPLYLECLLPLYFVEQKQGWSSMGGKFPTQFRIKELPQRATEFILALDVFERRNKEQQIAAELAELTDEWNTERQELTLISRRLPLSIQNVPLKPLTDWTEQPETTILVSYQQAWIPFNEYLDTLKSIAQRLGTESQVTGDSGTKTLEKSIETIKTKASTLQDRIELAREEEQALLLQISRIRERRAIIDEDLVKNQDVIRLRSLGVGITIKAINNECPTCHQPLADSLLHPVQNIMPIEENIDYLEDQSTLYRYLQTEHLSKLSATRKELDAAENELSSYQNEIRTLYAQYYGDDISSQEARDTELLRIKQRIADFETTENAIRLSLKLLFDISKKWAALQKERKGLPADLLSINDNAKLALLEKSFQEQLLAYNLISLDVSKIRISHENYLPLYDGYDLPTELSASDSIRVMCAYRIALMEVAREFSTNHPGILILDEPRQQSTSPMSFGEVLQRLSECGKYNQQAIIALREDQTALEVMLKDKNYIMKSFESSLFTLLPEPG
jgi:hypothetical protein